MSVLNLPVRSELAHAIRSDPKQVNILLGGVDDGKAPTPKLFYIDYMGSMHPVTKAAHGHCSSFALRYTQPGQVSPAWTDFVVISSTMDRFWRPNMTLDQGLDLLRRILKVLGERFLIDLPAWTVKIATAEGTRVIDFNE